MRTLTFRILPVFICLIVLGSLPAQPASAQPSPVGKWVGVVPDHQRNITVKLGVGKLVIGAVNGEMRWGTPRVCSLRTEYAGMRDGDYALNISGSDGGWCDLYRDGILLLHLAPDAADKLTFKLSDRQGGGVVQDTLSAVPSGH